MYEIKEMDALYSLKFQSDMLQGRMSLENFIGFVIYTLSTMGRECLVFCRTSFAY
jgi:hypothetical protein